MINKVAITDSGNLSLTYIQGSMNAITNVSRMSEIFFRAYVTVADISCEVLFTVQ